MQLSAEIFEQIVASLREQDEAADSEKRRKPRVGLKAARVNIVPLNSEGQPESPVSVHVRDISSEGICISDHEAMRKGKRFIVRLPRTGVSEPVMLICTVKHCRMISDDKFDIGAEFETICKSTHAAQVTDRPAA